MGRRRRAEGGDRTGQGAARGAEGVGRKIGSLMSAGRTVTLLTERRLSSDQGELIGERPSGEQHQEDDGSHGSSCEKNEKEYGIILSEGGSVQGRGPVASGRSVDGWQPAPAVASCRIDRFLSEA